MKIYSLKKCVKIEWSIWCRALIFSLFLVPMFTFSQVIIGGSTGTAANKTSVLLDFPSGKNRGIILPYVRTMPSGSNVTPGTMLLDVSTATKAKVKYYAPGNALADISGWVDLSSGDEANVSTIMSSQPLSTGTNPVIEDPNGKAIIGAANSNAKGVLVLESTTKAMVLPQVAKTDDVKDPAPGMMVYIKKNGAKRLAVFNGAKWTYWAANP